MCVVVKGPPHAPLWGGPTVDCGSGGAAAARGARAGRSRFGIQAVDSSGGGPYEVSSRTKASERWVTSQTFATARWRCSCRRRRSCSRGAQQGRLQRWSYQQWKLILGQDRHFGRRRRRPIWHSDRPHGGWLGQAPRGGIASALQPWHRETQRSARGGVAQHDVLSGSATGRVCVSYVCGSAAHGARAPRTTGECVWSPFSRCFDRAWAGPLRKATRQRLIQGSRLSSL